MKGVDWVGWGVEEVEVRLWKGWGEVRTCKSPQALPKPVHKIAIV